MLTHNQQKRTVLVMVNFLGFQTMVIDPFHAVVVFGLGFDFLYTLVSSREGRKDFGSQFLPRQWLVWQL